jgi:hypothetical protein
MIRTLIPGFILSWLGAAILCLSLAGLVTAPNADASAPRCQEDAPCWHWPTMGNHKRGIVTMNGTPLVVGPCRFARMMRAGNIDYQPTDYLRGDRWAMRHGCGR